MFASLNKISKMTFGPLTAYIHGMYGLTPFTIDFYGLTAAPLAPNVSSATGRHISFSLAG